ncbi:MAG: hypothetical protein AB1798_16945 [Spirochaetota bacterium]
MIVTADGFQFDFQDAVDAFVFDQQDRGSAHFHGLSHAMKAVDLIVELENDYLFVEVKDLKKSPLDYSDGGCFNHLRESLKYKYRDSFLYRWAEDKVNKPIRYLCLLNLENAFLSRMNKEVKKQLPLGKANARWQRPIAESCAVLNQERWNRNFPKWPVQKVE